MTVSTWEVMVRLTSYALSVVGRKEVRRRGSSVDRAFASASPRAESARSTDDSTSSSQPSTSSGTGGSVGMVPSCLTSSRRCWAAMPSPAAWCTTGANSTGTTKSVRRIASILTSRRSSYIVRETSSSAASEQRASTER